MGESKRKLDRLTPVQRMALEATKKLTDDGLIVKAGFVGFMAACFPNGCQDYQRQELELAFMGGAAHLLSSIMTIIDPGSEPTERDLRRMDIIDRELREFGALLEARAAINTKTEGSA